MDPNAISKAIPGVENFTTVGENDYETQLKLGVGAISGQYSGRVTITDVDAPTYYKMKVGGKGQRGFVNGEGSVTLEPQGEKTVVNYTGDAALGGQLAGIGQRLVEGAARTVINQGFKSLEGQLAERRAATPTAVDPSAEGSSESATPAAVSEGVRPTAPASPPPATSFTQSSPPTASRSSIPTSWIVAAIAILGILYLFLRGRD